MVIFLGKLIANPVGGLDSNKPPKPSPDPNIYPDCLEFVDGRCVWRSLPKPDHLTILGHFTVDHFPGADEATLDKRVYGLVEGLSEAQSHLDETVGFVDHKSLLGRFALPVGPRSAPIRIEVRKRLDNATQKTSFSMRMEFNPRKVQPPGFLKLIEVMKQVGDQPFSFAQFLSTSHPTRLDVAVDYAGIVPEEVFVSATNAGKRVEYFGPDGFLETIQLHTKRKVPKAPLKTPPRNPLGPLAAKVYSRNRERAAMGKKPPLAGHEVTRLEVVKKRFPSEMTVANLAKKSDPFKRVGVSYASALATSNPEYAWARYLACRRAVGPGDAPEVSGLGEKCGSVAEKILKEHPSNLFAGFDWKKWEAGIKETGLDQLVKLAAEGQSTSTA